VFRETESYEMDVEFWSSVINRQWTVFCQHKIYLLFYKDINVAKGVKLRTLEWAGRVCRMEMPRTLTKT
jgi:hypothetical protein